MEALLLDPKAVLFVPQQAGALGRKWRQTRGLLATPFFLLLSCSPPHPADLLALNRGLFCFSLLPLNVDVLGHQGAWRWGGGGGYDLAKA